MSLEKIAAQLKGIESNIPPVELWDPPYCGEMDLVIKSDGTWFYQGTPFKRPSLVQLLASVLKKEDEEYFLVTPVEKIKISVEDAPFVINQWHWLEQDSEPETMLLSTQIGDEFLLNEQHPIDLLGDGQIYVCVRRNLWGRVHRNVYYQWIDMAEHTKEKEQTKLIITSAGSSFTIGVYDNEAI